MKILFRTDGGGGGERIPIYNFNLSVKFVTYTLISYISP